MSTVAEALSLADLVARVAAEYDNIDQAVDAADAEAKDDPDMVHEAARRGYREMIHDKRHQWRGQAKVGQHTAGSNGQPQPCARNTADVFARINQTASEALLEMRVGDKRLGDLTGTELAEVGEGMQEQGKGLLRTGRFYSGLAKKTPAKGLVRNAWTERRARGLWESTK